MKPSILLVVLALVVAACGGGATPGGDEPPAADGAADVSEPADGGSSPSDGERRSGADVDGPSIWVVGNEGFTMLRYTPDLKLADRSDEFLGDLEMGLTVGFVSLAGDLWFTYQDELADRLVRVDTGDYEITSTVDLPTYPLFVTRGRDRLWVTYDDEPTVTRIAADGTAAAISTGSEVLPTKVIETGNGVWLLDALENRMYRMDPETGSLDLAIEGLATARILGSAAVGDAIWTTVEDPIDFLLRLRPEEGISDRIWCEDASGTCDAYPDELFATAELEGGAFFALDIVEIDGMVYVAGGSPDLFYDTLPLYEIDPESLQIVNRLDLEPIAGMVELGGDLFVVVSTNADETACGRVYRIDPSSLDVVDQVDLPDDVCPNGLDVG